MNAFSPHGLDIACLLASIAMFALYNVIIWRKLKTDPIYTIQGATDLARRAWVAAVMKERNGILAVQTLRNSTMAATFMASTSVLLSVGVLSLTGQAENLAATWHTLNVLGSTQQSTLALKLLVILVNLFIAFFSFSSSIRLFNHVGFMINAPSSEESSAATMTFVLIQLNRAANHFHVGMRAFYFLVPLVLWMFGPLLLVAGTVVMIAVVYYLDRVPAMLCDTLNPPCEPTPWPSPARQRRTD